MVTRHMEIEELYRAAIVALKNRQWEQATKHLLSVVDAAPQHQDAARVLMQLERLRPVSYWRGAFMFAIEHSAWDQAEAAAAHLNEIDPALHNAQDVTTRLQELTAIGWYLPQTIVPPEVQPPAGPEPTSESTLPAPEATPPSPEAETWLENLAKRQERQAMAGPQLDDIITPYTLDVPLDRLAALDEAGEWHAPSPAPAAPPDPEPEKTSSDDVNLTPRALKATEFSAVDAERSRENQRGPIYDTLSTPRALKTATFSPPSPASEGQEASPPLQETGETPATPTSEAPDDPPESTSPPSEELPASAEVRRVLPPVTATIDASQPYDPPQVKEPRAPTRTYKGRLRYRLIVAALVALLIVTLALIARLARDRAATAPTPEASSPNESLAIGELPALITSLDLALSTDDPSSEAPMLADLQAQIEALTPADSPLRTAFMSWLEAGRQRLAARSRLDTTCGEANPDPIQCTSRQEDYDLAANRERLARNVVCILAGCPSV